MICNWCGKNEVNDSPHWAECPEAPDFVKYQAKAELRGLAGGPYSKPYKLTPSSPLRTCTHNHIDRGEPDCREE
jgi:hypothetical protein